MSRTLQRVIELVVRDQVRISVHGYDELASDEIKVREVLAGVANGLVVEDYPEYPKGPCVLVLQREKNGAPIHIVWGIPRGADSPAVVVTAYRPNPQALEA